MLRLILVAFCCLGSAALAGPDTTADQRASLSGTIAMLQGCYATAPSFQGAQKVFAEIGFRNETSDPSVFAAPNGGFAGLGEVGIEGEDTTITSCLVYNPGGLVDYSTIGLVGYLLSMRVELFSVQRVEESIYVLIEDSQRGAMLAAISYKESGPYAGHTLLALTPR